MDHLNLEYKKYKLKNGLEVILHQNKNLPLAAVNVWYKVGSANEVKGKTGLAHLFEHMMFQGSQNVPKEMHFRFIQEAGGTLNGSTTLDRTNYYEKVPSNFLEMILWLESDRMGFLLPALDQEKLNNQKDVVANERLERYDNQPYGLAWELIVQNIFPQNHSYSWPTIGFMNDIKNYSLEDVKNFFKTYYSPANAALVTAGDFDENEVVDLIEKYFADIPFSNSIPKINLHNQELKESNLLIHEDEVQLERIHLAWLSDKAYSENDATFDVLGDILSGSKSSKLYKSLVFEKEIAQDVSAFQFSGKLDGAFMIIATAKPGINTNELKKEILSEIEKISKGNINKKELLKSKNGIKANFISSLQNVDSIADQLNSYNFFTGEPNYFSEDLRRYEIIDEAKISNLVDEFLTKPFFELRIIPKKQK
jgi:zinc protease